MNIGKKFIQKRLNEKIYKIQKWVLKPQTKGITFSIKHIKKKKTRPLTAQAKRHETAQGKDLKY